MTTAATWKLQRGKGWKKWISADGRSWVTQWLCTPDAIYCGIDGEFVGVRQMSPQDAMARIERIGCI